MTRGRPPALHRQIEDILLDHAYAESVAMADGVKDQMEREKERQILLQLVPIARKLIPTLAVCVTFMTSADGMYGEAADRVYAESRRNMPANVVEFQARTHGGGEAA